MASQSSLKIGVSGVRGIVGEALTPQLVTSFSAAFGAQCGSGPIVVGTDTRPSREMVKSAVVAGLLSVGCAPIDLGVVPVPALQLHLRRLGALGGICLTASHNPIEWNALKFFASDGILLRPNRAQELTDLYHQGTFPRVSGSAIERVRYDGSAIQAHRDAVLASLSAAMIRERRLRVAIDCCNGAASLASPAFLDALGCEVTPLYVDPDSPFPHNPEPIPENLHDLRRLVRSSRADVGFAQDADADRLAIIDGDGQPLGEECTLALAVRRALQRHSSPVVANASTSRMVDDVAAQFGAEVLRSKVGEINVVELMLASGAEIGGEGNGGVIMPRCNPCRDSFVAMGLVLEALASEGCTMADLRSRFPAYGMVKEKLTVRPREISPALHRLRLRFAGERQDYTDGVKVVWPDRWVHARPSNTEPIIRIVAEAPTEAEAAALSAATREALFGGHHT